MRFAEVDILGVHVSPTAPMLAAAWLVTVALRAIAARLGLLGWAWHPPLFTLCAFVAILAGIVLAAAA